MFLNNRRLPRWLFRFFTPFLVIFLVSACGGGGGGGSSGGQTPAPAPVDTSPTLGTVANQEFLQNEDVDFLLPAGSGGNAPLRYSLTGTLPVGLNFSTATRRITGTPTEITAATTLTYTVTDNDGDTASTSFTVAILEDLQPQFADGARIDNINSIVSDPINVTVPEGSGGNEPLSYSLEPDLPDGLTLDTSTFEISGTPNAPLESAEFTYSVSDSDGDSVSITFNIEIEEDLAPQFGEATIDDQIFNVSDEVVAIALPIATSGNPPLSYKVEPDLPPGLTFDMSQDPHSLSGIPTAAQQVTAYTFSVEDADINAESAELSFTIEVTPDLVLPAVADMNLQQDDTVSFVLPEATGGKPPLTYSIQGTLPEGLVFDSESRELRGVPTQETMAVPLEYTVVDAAGFSVMVTFFITVVDDQLPMLDHTFPDWTYEVGDSVFIQLPRSSTGNHPLTYELIGDLPDGLTFNPSSLTITGTATSVHADSAYAFIVTDADGDRDVLGFHIEVLVKLAIATDGLTFSSPSMFEWSPTPPVQPIGVTAGYLPQFDGAASTFTINMNRATTSDVLVRLESITGAGYATPNVDFYICRAISSVNLNEPCGDNTLLIQPDRSNEFNLRVSNGSSTATVMLLPIRDVDDEGPERVAFQSLAIDGVLTPTRTTTYTVLNDVGYPLVEAPPNATSSHTIVLTSFASWSVNQTSQFQAELRLNNEGLNHIDAGVVVIDYYHNPSTETLTNLLEPAQVTGSRTTRATRSVKPQSEEPARQHEVSFEYLSTDRFEDEILLSFQDTNVLNDGEHLYHISDVLCDVTLGADETVETEVPCFGGDSAREQALIQRAAVFFSSSLGVVGGACGPVPPRAPISIPIRYDLNNGI